MAWLARTDYGLLYLYQNKPIRNSKIKSWDSTGGYVIFIEGHFDKCILNKTITWNDEPIEIEIKVKEEKL